MFLLANEVSDGWRAKRWNNEAKWFWFWIVDIDIMYAYFNRFHVLWAIQWYTYKHKLIILRYARYGQNVHVNLNES